MFIDNVFALDFYVFHSLARAKTECYHTLKKWLQKMNRELGASQSLKMVDVEASRFLCVWVVNCNSKRRYFERLFITFAFNLRVHTFKLLSIFSVLNSMM